MSAAAAAVTTGTAAAAAPAPAEVRPTWPAAPTPEMRARMRAEVNLPYGQPTCSIVGEQEPLLKGLANDALEDARQRGAWAATCAVLVDNDALAAAERAAREAFFAATAAACAVFWAE